MNSDNFWNAQHQRWLKKLHEHSYDREYALNMLFDACSDLQGLPLNTAVDMWAYARHVIGIWDVLMGVVDIHNPR